MAEKEIGSAEFAEGEFKRWAEENDIDIDESKMNDEEKKSFNTLKGKIVKAIQKGSLTLNDNCEFEYKLSDKNDEGIKGKVMKISTPNFRAFCAMDDYKDHQTMHKTAMLLSAITGNDTSFINKIVYTDIKVLSAIVTFMLAD